MTTITFSISSPTPGEAIVVAEALLFQRPYLQEQFAAINAKLDALQESINQQAPNAAELTAYREVLFPAVIETVQALDAYTPEP